MTEQQDCDELSKAFDTERVEWKKKVLDVINLLEDASKLSFAQAQMLSYRHIIVDKIASYKNAANDMKSRDSIHKMHLEGKYYSEPRDRKVTDKEVTAKVQGDMAHRSRKLNLLLTQLDYFSSTIDTLDKIGYAVKNKITIEDMHL